MTIVGAARRTRSPKPGTPAWTAERRRAVFATDAASAAGLSRFGDPIGLYLEKVGMSAPKIQLERMAWGRILEEPVAKEWARRQGRKISRVGHWTYWRDDLGFPMASHTDFVTDADDLLEVKTASAYSQKDFGESGTDEIPMDYRLQLVHELAVLDRPRAHLAALIGGNELRSYVVERDPELEKMLLGIEEDFWAHVQARNPPPIDGSEGASEYIRVYLAADNGQEIELDEATADLAMAVLAAREQKRAAEQAALELENKLKVAMGEAALGRGEGITVTFRRNKDGQEIRWAEVAEELRQRDLGDLIATHTYPKNGARPLLVRHDAP